MLLENGLIQKEYHVFAIEQAQVIIGRLKIET